MLRLMKYKRVLIQLRTLGLERVFSNNLGDAISVSASLVRKDLARINLQGNRRGGYNINTMLEQLNRLLGSGGNRRAILAGCGNLGQALLNHEGFLQEGISIIAGFDIAPPAYAIGGTPIYPMDQIEDFIKTHKPRVAILAVPSPAAAEVRDRILKCGIRGILNFAPMELKCPKDFIIHNVNIGLEIENLFFRVNAMELPCLADGTCEE